MMYLPSTLRERLGRPVDIASLAMLRVMFGLLVVFASLRFVAYGWVDRFYVQPGFHFHYWGLGFVEALPAWAMHGAFWLMAALGAMIALGVFARPALLAFALVFSYVELIDVAMYLNHYYLVSLLALALALTPCHRALSLDARLRPALAADRAPAWALYLIRFQVGTVYVFAALAKLQPDWLIHAQPLNIWLHARADLPLIGWALVHWETALVIGWAGFLFDLTVVFWLGWRRTRPWAYAAVLGFHSLTGQLFPIGLFPLIMVLGATIFFDPSWPRGVKALGSRLVRKLSVRSGLLAHVPAPLRTGGQPRGSRRKTRSTLDGAERGARGDAARGHPLAGPGFDPPPLLALALGLYVVFHVLMPLRSHLYPGGPVIWHEQGMRWSWRVMVREKNGAVTYRVRLPDGRRQLVEPSRYLTEHQEREMSGQPDLIVQLAHHIGRTYAERYGEPVQVRVDALVSLNGRPAAPLIDPDVDLMGVEPDLRPASWILPAPQGPPPRLSPLPSSRQDR